MLLQQGQTFGENNDLKISFQLSIPSKNTSDSASSSSPDTVIDTIESSSIESGISLANGYVSKKLNLSHCKVIVLSEEIAVKGISDIIYTLINNVEVRPDCNIIISRSDAYNFLSESKSEIESITSKYYEIIATSSKYTGYTSDITISDVFDRISDTFGEASTILGSITASNSKNGNKSDHTGASAVDTDTIAGETTSSSGDSGAKPSTNIDVVGLAVFKEDVLVGELSSIETLCHLMVINELEECIISIPSPFDADSIIDLYVTLDENTKNKVNIINDSPFISTKIRLSAKILSSTKNSNYFDSDNLETIEKYANSYMKAQLENYLYKISKEYGSDIDLFGRYAVKYFPTWDKWVEYNWVDNFKNSFFDVDVLVNVTSSYLIS